MAAEVPFFLSDYHRPLKMTWVEKFRARLLANHGRTVEQLSGHLTSEHLWLAVHGRPVIDRQIAPSLVTKWLSEQDEELVFIANTSSSKKKTTAPASSETDKKE